MQGYKPNQQVESAPTSSFEFSPFASSTLRTNMPPLTQVGVDICHGDKDVSIVDGTSDIGELDPADRARLLRKLDWHILPLVTLLYLLSFL